MRSLRKGAATYGRMSNWAIKEIGQTVGLRHVTVPNFNNVRTQHDLNRFIRKVDERAMQATLAIIVQPLMDRGYSIEFLRRLIEKTYGISDSVKNKELALLKLMMRWQRNTVLFFTQKMGQHVSQN